MKARLVKEGLSDDDKWADEQLKKHYNPEKNDNIYDEGDVPQKVYEDLYQQMNQLIELAIKQGINKLDIQNVFEEILSNFEDLELDDENDEDY